MDEQRLFDELGKIHSCIGEVKTEVSGMKQHLGTINGTVKNLCGVVWGDPAKMGEGGLIHKQSEQDKAILEVENKTVGVGKSFDGFKKNLWLGVVALVGIIKVAFEFIPKMIDLLHKQ